MHPAVGARNGGPEGGVVLETATDQLAQPDEARRRGPPFLVAWPRPPVRVTRSRLPAIFSRRVFSFSPEAASGARPSSVIARAHGRAVPADHRGCGIAATLAGPLHGADAAYLLLQLLLGMAIRLVDRMGGLAQ